MKTMSTHSIINSSPINCSDGEFFLSQPLTIMLTACTHPHTETNTPPVLRECQIEQSIGFYSSLPFVKNVVAVDNSDYNIMQFNKIEKVIALHVSPVVDCGADTKKFYASKTAGEIQLIRTALESIPNNDFVVKITGRLLISELAEIITYLDFTKFNVAQYYPKEHWLSTWFFGTPCKMLKDLFRDEFDMRGTLENMLFERLPSEIIKPIKGEWKVVGKPDSACVYHTPNYCFDGVTELEKKEGYSIIEKLFPSLIQKGNKLSLT